jgi:brefeldin A-resistance guanine nucleotide exchange factor 1
MPLSEDELHQRRLKKTAMKKMAELFNEKPTGTAWLDLAVESKLVDSAENATAVAELLYTVHHLDKAQVGIYLSKGPDADYPFHASVRKEFVARYDFTDLPFSAAIRLFLSRFRLPGEAQCIDRFMESFSSELFSQQKGVSTIFKDADAVYVLSFSTIMLNTDLHNPQIRDENRMTVDQFVRNNRGINGGEDLPEDYLLDLYHQIKETQIQVQKEVNDFMNKYEGEDLWTSWDSMLSRGRDVASPFFTPAHLARGAPVKAGVHDKEMFTVVAQHAIKCIPAILRRSWDDAIVVKALRGLRQMASIADYFGMDELLNQVIHALLAEGRDYVVNCITQDHARGMSREHSMRSVSSADDDATDTQTTEAGIPYSLLSSGKGYSEVSIAGAANHRGLLAIDSGFVLVRRYTKKIISAWPMFIECLCALRDARALPPGLSDLDDFADSNGNVLPLSPYAKASQKRLDDFYRSKSVEPTEKPEGWFSGLFRRKAEEEQPKEQKYRAPPSKRPGHYELSEESKALLAVAEITEVESIVQMGSTILPTAEETIKSLLEVVDEYPYEENPVTEQHAIFSLELAARALLSNREKAPELFPVFLQKFENILSKITDKHIPSPFVIERIAVTILRCSIHLYENEEMRPTLRVSLQLIFISIPSQFTKYVADRMACGLAIILRASYYCFQSHNEWTFVGDSLDMLAQFGLARVFAFDGIASTVEYALPQYGASGEVEANPDEHGDDDERPTLSKEACSALSRILIRFALGFYRGDVTLAVPATVCLEKLYRHKNALLIKAEAASKDEPVPTNIRALVPDKEFWQNVAVAVYAVCRSPNPETSKHGYECCQRILLRTPASQIADDKWIAILFLMVNKQPPTAADFSRANTFVLLGNLLKRTLPQLSVTAENRDDLTDLVKQIAVLAEENLRVGRRGTVSPLFDKTLQTVTYLANHLQSGDWKGDKEFGSWVSEIFLAELEKVGAAGAVLQNKAATQKQQPESSEQAPIREETADEVAGEEESPPV